MCWVGLIRLTGSTVATLHMNDQCTVQSIMPCATHVVEGGSAMLKSTVDAVLNWLEDWRTPLHSPIWLNIVVHQDRGVIGWCARDRRRPVEGRDTFRK